MAGCGHADNHRPHLTIGDACRLRGASHARVKADIRIGIDIQHVKGIVAEPHIHAGVIPTAQSPIGLDADFLKRAFFIDGKSRGEPCFNFLVMAGTGNEFGLKRAKTVLHILEEREIHFRRR